MTSSLSQADQYLLDAIRRGDPAAWEQFVQRYQGRLLAFAQGRLGQAADAEDLVQETFINFLKGMDVFRGQASLETYLFTILRRKIIDAYRSSGARKVGLIQDIYPGDAVAAGSERPSDPFGHFSAETPTASWYARNAETQDQQKGALTEAVTELIEALKAALKFRDLKIVELLFYCKLANKDIAALLDITENNVALIKHRCLKQLHGRIERLCPDTEGLSGELESTLAALWESRRLSCLKRSTLGQYHLGSLEPEWADYADFHLNRLGCLTCRASLEDLQRQTAAGEQKTLHKRILESSVGFLKKADERK